MKFFRAPALASLLMLGSLAAHAETPIINLSIGGEISPGVYGQVQFGNGPPPPVLYPRPSIVIHQPPGVVLEPIYLHVPPGHARNWSKYCRTYNACKRPVYFVKSAEYEPGYQSRNRDEDRRDEDHRDEWRGDENHKGERRRD
jgi:hypothetical protein